MKVPIDYEEMSAEYMLKLARKLIRKHNELTVNEYKVVHKR